MATEASRIIELELAELICIEHTLSPSQAIAGSTESGVLGPGKETCLKVGAGILEALPDRSRAIGISLTEEELWLLRERVSIYTSQGANADLGLVIKAKLYEALLSVGNERAAEAVLGEIATAEVRTEAGMSREEVDDALSRWQEVSGYRPDPGTGGEPGPHGADDDSQDETGPQTPVKS